MLVWNFTISLGFITLLLNSIIKTTNLGSTNTTTTSDADTSLDDDMSLDESSEDEKETIQVRKKPKVSDLDPTETYLG